MICHDNLPKYRLALDTTRSPDMVVVYTKDVAALHMELMRSASHDWFMALERYDNKDKWRPDRSAAKRASNPTNNPANEDAIS